MATNQLGQDEIPFAGTAGISRRSGKSCPCRRTAVTGRVPSPRPAEGENSQVLRLHEANEGSLEISHAGLLVLPAGKKEAVILEPGLAGNSPGDPATVLFAPSVNHGVQVERPFGKGSP